MEFRKKTIRFCSGFVLAIYTFIELSSWAKLRANKIAITDRTLVRFFFYFEGILYVLI